MRRIRNVNVGMRRIRNVNSLSRRMLRTAGDEDDAGFLLGGWLRHPAQEFSVRQLGG